MKEEMILRWIKRAESDLKAVEQLLTFEDAPTDVISFHCQQAVEKYLKAYLTLADVRVKKTPDLETILNLCAKEDDGFQALDKEGVSRLSLFAVEIRYPEEYFEPTADEAKRNYEIAREVREFVRSKLKEKGIKLTK